MKHVFCSHRSGVRLSNRSSFITLGIALVAFSVAATFRPVISQAQGTAAGSEKFVREQVASGNVTTRQLRMVWQFLQEKRIYDPQDSQTDDKGKAVAAKPVADEEAALVRHLSTQFTAFNFPNDLKANPPAILPGDLLVQFFAWDKTGGVVVIRGLANQPDRCKVLIYVEKDKSYTESIDWGLSLYPDIEPRHPPRPGLMWLRPKAAIINLSATASSGSANVAQANEVLLSAVKLLTGRDTVKDLDNWPSVQRALALGATNVTLKVDEYSLLDFAAMFNDSASTSILLKRGLSAKDNNSLPLQLAASWNSDKVVPLLLAAGADASAKDALGRTPLHDAAQSNAGKVIAPLLAGGADINARDIMNWTPLKMARQKGHATIAAQLEAAGGKE